MTKNKKRVVIAGLGDTGVLTAIHLADHCDVVGISPKPCLVSGQELGLRLSQPERWKQNFLNTFSRYRKLDNVRRLQGKITAINPDQNNVDVILADGSRQTEPYDVLVISSGVKNGFWRNTEIETLSEIAQKIDTNAERLANANSIAIVGGGASAVSVAANTALHMPQKEVHLFYSRDYLLPDYHQRTRTEIEQILCERGVQLHPGHRAVLPGDMTPDQLTEEPISWSSGQAPFKADLVLWATGQSKPNNDFIPADMLDENGFVSVKPSLQVSGYHNVFAIGDIAATDKHRSSARNFAYGILAHNVQAFLKGKEGVNENL